MKIRDGIIEPIVAVNKTIVLDYNIYAAWDDCHNYFLGECKKEAGGK